MARGRPRGAHQASLEVGAKLFISCLYIAALFATFLAAVVTKRHNHRMTMLSKG